METMAMNNDRVSDVNGKIEFLNFLVYQSLICKQQAHTYTALLAFI